jgi:NitT/TauT family transport system substrate-binding protein
MEPKITHVNKARCIQHHLLRLSRAAAALLTCVCLIACNRSDHKPADPPEKIRIAYATLPETALAQIAQARGYYRDEGLEAIPRLHSFGKLALRDVLDGKADLATVAETPLMFAIMNGEKIAVIASIQCSRKNHAIIARRDKGILRPEDLKGRKIATTMGITSEYFLDAFIAMQGIVRKELEAVNLKPEEYQEAIVNGHVDAVSAFYPYLKQIQNKLGVNGITFYDEEVYIETFSVVATQEFIRQNPGKIRKLLRALLRAEEFARGNPAEAHTIVAVFSGIDKGIVSEIWADNRFAVSLDQSLILGLEDESRWAIKGGLFKAKVVPNYLDFIYFEGLKSVKPEAVRILR